MSDHSFTVFKITPSYPIKSTQYHGHFFGGLSEHNVNMFVRFFSLFNVLNISYSTVVKSGVHLIPNKSYKELNIDLFIVKY